MPPSPPLLLCPTIDIPKKLTESMFKVTVIIFNDMLESVTDENEDVRHIPPGPAGLWCLLRRCWVRRRPLPAKRCHSVIKINIKIRSTIKSGNLFYSYV